MAVKDYNVDPDLNTTIEGINIAEGCPPSGINNAIRQLMADVKVESEAKAEAISAAGEALEAFAETQATRDAAQDAAIAAAKSSAEEVAEELVKYLPLTGGKMKGNLAPSSLYANTPAGAVTFGVGTAWNDSPSLSLYGSNFGDPNAGNFVLRAGNQTYELFGKVSGELKWGGKNIVRSVNNVTADASGNVAVDKNSEGYGLVACSAQGTGFTRFGAVQICFFNKSISKSNGWVSFPKAFKDTGYAVGFMHTDNNTTATTFYPKISSKETAGMNVVFGANESSVTVDFVIIGFWR